MPRPYDDFLAPEIPDYTLPPPGPGGLRKARMPRLETPFETLERMERQQRDIEEAKARIARLRGEEPDMAAGGGLRRRARGYTAPEPVPEPQPAYMTPAAPPPPPPRPMAPQPATRSAAPVPAPATPAPAPTPVSTGDEFVPSGIQPGNALSTDGAGTALESFGRGVERNAGEAVGGTVGLWAGAKGGAALGGAVGAMFGGVGAPVGAAIGGIAGGIAGMFGGGWVGKQTQRAVMGEEAWQRAEEQYQRDMAAHPLATLGGSLAPHAATFLVSPGGALKIGTKGVQAADAARAGSVAWMKAGRAGRVSEEALRLADSVEAAGKSVREAQRHIRMTRGAVEVLNRTGAARTDLGARVVESLSGRVLAYTTALEKEEAALKAARAAGVPIIGRVGQARVAKTARAAKYAYMGRAATDYGEDGEYNAYAPEVYSTTGDRLLTDAEVAWAASRKGGKGFINQLATERVTDPDKLLGSIPFLGSWHNAAKRRDIEARRKRLADPAAAYGADYYANPQYRRDRERVIADENARRIDAAREQSIRGIAGQIIGDMPAFMIEIAHTPELGNLGAGRGALARVGGGMLQATIQSNFQPGAVAAGYEQNRGNEWTITDDDWGALNLAVERSGDSEIKALWKGWAQNAIEYVSETMGDYMQAGVAAGGRRLMKATKPMPKKLGKFLADVFGDSPSVGKVRGAMRAGAVQPFFESLEERAGDFLKAAILADDRDEGEDYWQHLFASLNPGWKQWLAEQLAFLPLGGLQIAGAIGERRRREREDRGGGEGSAPSPTGTPPGTGGSAPATGGAAPSAEGEISDEKLMALKNRLADFLRSHGAPEGTVGAVANAQEAADIHEAMNGMVVDAAMQALRPRLTEEQWGDLQGFRDPRQRLAQAARLVSRYSEMDNALLAASAALENEDAPDDLLARTADLLTSLKPEWREMADLAANPREALMEIAAQANAELADGTLDPADPRWKDVTARDLAARLQGAEAAAADARIADIATEALVGDLPAAARAEYDGLATPEEKAQWLDRRLRDPNAALNAVLSVGRHISRPDVDAPEAMFASVLDQLKGRFAGPWALSGGDSAAGTPRERLATLVAEIDKDEANRQFLETFARDPYAADSFDPSYVEMPSAVDDRLRPEGEGGMAAEDALAGEEAEEGTEAEPAPAPAPEAPPAAQEAAESAPAPAPSNEPAPAAEAPQEPAAAPETPPAAEAKEVQPGEERYTREQLEALDIDTLRSMARATGLFPGGLSKTPLINILMRIQDEAVAWEPPETTEEQRAKSTVILSKWLHDGDTVMFADGSTGAVSKDGAFGPATIQTDRHGTLSIDEERSISALAVYRDGQEVTADLRSTTLGDSADTDKERQARAKRIAKRLPGIKVAVVGDSSKGIPAKIAADFKANPDGKALFDEDTATIYLGAKSDFSSLPHEVFHAILHWSKTHARGLHGQLRTLMSSAPESAKEWARSHYAGREGATDDAILEEAAAELWGRTLAEDISAEERREADRLADRLASQEMTWWDKVRELCARILEKFVAHVPEKSRGRAADGTPVSLDDLKNLSPEQAARRLFDAIFNGTGINWQGKEWKADELPARKEQEQDASDDFTLARDSWKERLLGDIMDRPADEVRRTAAQVGIKTENKKKSQLAQELAERGADNIMLDSDGKPFSDFVTLMGATHNIEETQGLGAYREEFEAIEKGLKPEEREKLMNLMRESLREGTSAAELRMIGYEDQIGIEGGWADGYWLRRPDAEQPKGEPKEEPPAPPAKRKKKTAKKKPQAPEGLTENAGIPQKTDNQAPATEAVKPEDEFANRILDAIETDARDGLIAVRADNRYGEGAYVANYAAGSKEEVERAAAGIRKAFPNMEVLTSDTGLVLKPKKEAEKAQGGKTELEQAQDHLKALREELRQHKEAQRGVAYSYTEAGREAKKDAQDYTAKLESDIAEAEKRIVELGGTVEKEKAEPPSPKELSNKSTTELQRLARENGLPTAGTRTELIMRLAAHFGQQNRQPATEEQREEEWSGPQLLLDGKPLTKPGMGTEATQLLAELWNRFDNRIWLQEYLEDLRDEGKNFREEYRGALELLEKYGDRITFETLPQGTESGNVEISQQGEQNEPADRQDTGNGRGDTGRGDRAGAREPDDGTGGGEVPGNEPGPGGGNAAPGERRDNSREDDEVAGEGVGENGGGSQGANGDRRPRNADNHVITDPDFLDAGGAKAKFRDNLAALRVLKTLREEGREATPEEREIIAKYVGWGRSEFRNGLFAWYGGEWQKERDELKEVIGDEEFESARKSTLTAFWTPPRMAQAVWSALDHLGFKGGRIHEPSIGTGIFFGTMPTDVRDRSVLSGADKDVLASEIARALYPGARITNGAYQEENLPDDFYDLVVGNFPFADITIRRDKYNRVSANLHDYFWLKSLGIVRPGGLVAAITSTGTMDKANDAVRREIADKADVVAAIRLPEGTFSGVAGTDVVTDLIILRKREPGTEMSADTRSWLETVSYGDLEKGDEYLPGEVNQYYKLHPDHIVGHPTGRSGRFGMTTTIKLGPEESAKDRIDAILAGLPENVYSPRARKAEAPKTASAAELGIDASTLRDGSLVAKDGEIWENTTQGLVQVKAPQNQKRKAKFLIELRDTLNSLRSAEINDRPEGEIATLRKELNRRYDAFAKEYGPLSKPGMLGIMDGDPASHMLLALERSYDKEKNKAVKADIFTTRVGYAKSRATRADNYEQAAGFSMNETGHLDAVRVGEMMGVDTATAERELLGKGLAYRAPDGQLVGADEYLSGNVREKLRQAEAAARVDSAFKPNVEALRKVLPADKGPGDITVNLGATWVPADVMSSFASHILGVPEGEKGLTFEYNHALGRWLVSLPSDRYSAGLVTRSAAYNNTYATKHRSFTDILDAALHDQRIRITRRDPYTGETEFLAVESEEANTKADKLKDEFLAWVWQDKDRATRLSRIYNDTFNGFVERKKGGRWLTFPGIAPSITPRPHQVAAVEKLLACRRLLMAHEVGTGKTITYGLMAQKAKETGSASKPLLVVKNSTVKQVAAEIQRLFPSMNIFVGGESMTASRRKRSMAQIANNNWDLVILTHDNLGSLDSDPAIEQKFIDEQIMELRAAADAARRSGMTKKDIERIEKNLTKRIESLNERLKALLKAPKTDGVATFQDLGFDMVMVDECQAFKKLPIATYRTRVKGIPAEGSKRASALLMNIQNLLENNPEACIVFGSGTPLDNSLVEAYVWQRFLQNDLLRDAGITSFDAWASNFGRTTADLEMSPSGDGWKEVERFKEFVNLGELSSMMRQNMDVVFARDTGEIVRPRRHDSAEEVPETDVSREVLADLEARAKALKERRGKPKKGDDNMLVISGDGRKAAVHPGLYKPEYVNAKGTKADACIARVAQNHKADPKAAQMIFCDCGVNDTPWGFNLYRYIRDGLVKAGFKPSQVAFFSSNLSPAGRAALAEKMNNGEVLVAIGSTDTMGTGVNAQKRLRWMHHLDASRMMTPGSIEQRNGRGHRQGNTYKDVEVVSYVQVHSLDAFTWNLIKNKSGFINSFMQGEDLGTIEEESDTITPDQLVAVASGDPRVFRKAKIEKQLHRLRLQEAAFEQSKQDQAASKRNSEWQLKNLDREIKALESAAEVAASTTGKPFSAEVLKSGVHPASTHTERDAALSSALDAAVDATATRLKETEWRIASDRATVAKYRGFDIQIGWERQANSNAPRLRYFLELPDGSRTAYYLSPNFDRDDKQTQMLAVFRSADAIINGMKRKLQSTVEERANTARRIEELSAGLDRKFENAEKITSLQIELQQLNDALSGKDKEKQEGERVENPEESARKFQLGGTPPAPSDWSAAKIPEMRKALVARGLSPAGGAASLRSRLEADDRRKAERGGAVHWQKASPTDARRLEGAPKVRVYRAMQMVDGKLYPPMAAKVGGKWVDPTEPGTWYVADEHPELAIPVIDKRTGKQKVDRETGRPVFAFKLDKGNSSSITAAYNPYWHTSRTPLNDQFSSASKRPELVIVECEVPESELSSGYRAEKAKDTVGEKDWHSGPVSSWLAEQGQRRKVILSRYSKVVRVVPDAEVAEEVRRMLDGTGISIPEGVVTPSLRAELERLGVDISRQARSAYSWDKLAKDGKKPRTMAVPRFTRGAFAANATPKDMVAAAKESVRRAGGRDIPGRGLVINIPAFGDVVVVGKSGVLHGLRPYDAPYGKLDKADNADILSAAGEILRSSIPVNELRSRDGKTDGATLLLGAAADESGDIVPVVSVVNHVRDTNEIPPVRLYPLYSLNAKSRNPALSLLTATAEDSGQSVINIADLVEQIKDDVRIFSKDVYDHFKQERPAGEFSRLRFQRGGLFTGSAADYANRRADGTIENGPSLHKVGTGEGTQVFGWGLYASERRGVAEGYARTSQRRRKGYLGWRKEDYDPFGPEEEGYLAANLFELAGMNLAEAKEMAQQDIERAKEERSIYGGGYYPGVGDVELRMAIAKFLDKYGERFEKREEVPQSTFIYEQTFFTNRATPEETESHLLKWYEPVSEEQKKWILDEFAKEGKIDFYADGTMFRHGLIMDQDKIIPGETHGEEVYKMLVTECGSPKAASEFLARAGIDGVKMPVNGYRSSGRANGEETGWNYVSFRDDNIRVDHKWENGVRRFQRGGAPAAPVPNPWDNAHVELQAKKKGHEWHVVAADGTDMGRFATQQSAEFAIAQERAVLGAAADSLGKLKKARLAEIAEARRKLVDAMRKADATKEERADAIAALGRALGLHKDLAAKEWALAEKILRTHDPESTESAAETAERAVNTVLARASIKLHGRDMMRIVKQKAGGKVTGGLRRNALLPVRHAWDLMREQMTEEEKASRLDEMDRAIEAEAAELQAGEGPGLSRSELAERLGKLAEQMNERELFAVFGGLATIHGGANRARLAEDARAWADASATLASLSDRAASELKNKLIARAVQAKEIREQIIREMTGGRDIPASNQERQDAKNARGFGARARELVRGLVSASMGGGRNWGEVIVHDKSVSFGEGAASHLFHDGLAAGYKAEMEANEADREEGLRILSQHFAIDPNTDIHKLIDFSEKCETLFNDEAVDDHGRHEITVRTVHLKNNGKGKNREAAVVAGGPCTLKLGELMHFYLIGLQAEAAAGQPYTNTPKRTKGADCSLMEALVQHGYAAETMAEIRAALQKRGLDRLALQISADMEKKGDDLDALMAKEYNSQLKRVHPYAPLRRLHWGLTEQGDADGGGVGSFMSMVRSFLKERVSNTRDFQTVNLIESWQSHNRQANHIIHLHDWISTVGRVMRHADMQTALDFVVGDRTRRALNAWLDVQARGGSMVIRDDDRMSLLARNFAVAVTTNPRVALKQLTSPGMALGMLPEGASTWEWFKDMAAVALPGEKRRAFLAFLDGNSPEWRERGLNASDALSLINRHKAGDKYELLRLKVQRKLGAMTRWGDRTGALMGCYGVFKAWERKLLAQGMDPDAARIAALERFVDSVNAGQQSVLPEYMSQVQTMGGLYKYMTMFHTAQIAMTRNLYTHAKAFLEGRSNRREHARAIMGVVTSAWAFRLMGMGMLPLAQIILGLLQGDTEKAKVGATKTLQEGLMSIVEAPCSGVMPLGDAIVGLAEGAVKGGSGWGRTGNVDVVPQLSVLANVGRIVSDFRKSADKRDWLAVSKHAADFIGQTTGIPVTPVIDIGSGIYDAKTADDLTPEQRAARALSFSRSAIGAPRRKPTPKQPTQEDPWAIPAGQEWMYGLPSSATPSAGLRTPSAPRR